MTHKTLDISRAVFVTSLLCLAPACDSGGDGKTDDEAAKPGDKTEKTEKPGAVATSDTKKPAGGADAGAAAAPASIFAAPPTINEAFKKGLEGVVANCEVNPDGCTVSSCKASEHDELMKTVGSDEGQLKREDVLDTLAVALADADPKLQTVAVSVLYDSKFKTMSDVEAVDPAVAMRLVKAWDNLPQYQANQSSAAVVHATFLSDNDEVEAALYEAVESGAHESVKPNAIEDFLARGRLDALPKIQEYAKDGSEAVTSASLRAFSNMYELTEEEKGAICPWAAGFLADARLRVFEQAGRAMLKCGDEYVDKLLDEGEKRLANSHEFTRTHYMVFRNPCFGFIPALETSSPAKDARCERNFAFLQAAVDDDQVASDDRALALFAIYYQRRDAQTKKLMKKYKNHKDAAVAAKAKEILAYPDIAAL